MKYSKTILYLLSLASLLLSEAAAQAQNDYLANAQTVISTASPSVTNRLYLSGATLAPTNTTIWLVADTMNNGVSTNPPANQILGPDDLLIRAEVVPGLILGPNVAGRYSRTSIVVSNVVSTNAAIYVYLWNGQGVSFQPQQGSTFGLFRVGVVPAPEVGNARWLITTNVFANRFQVGAAVTLPPVITQQPTNLSVNVGGSATFTVQASGTPPLSYQWLRDGTNISFTTNSVLTLTNVTLADDAPYRVRVSNSATNVLSDQVRLTVNSLVIPPPQLTSVTAQVEAGSVIVSFSFATTSGASYQVQSATNLTAPIAWTNEGTVISGIGLVTNISTTNQSPPFQKFFRVVAN